MNPLVYEPRTCRFIGILEFSGNRIKIYSINSQKNENMYIQINDNMSNLIKESYHNLGNNHYDHPLGFSIIHLANDGWYILNLKWNNANNLRHSVYEIDSNFTTLKKLQDKTIIACLWEARLIVEESKIWQRHILSSNLLKITPEAEESYLKEVFNGHL